jgi:hypothetical protein
MSLPLELVREIIHLLLFYAPPCSSTPEDPGCSTKPTWGTINALSLSSHSYCTRVLEAWFRTLYIEWPSDLMFLRESGWFPEVGTKWTKHVHCVQLSSTLSFWKLSPFLRVSSIRLDWLLPTLSPSFTLPDADRDTLPFLHLSSSSLHSPTYSYRTPVGIRESSRTGLGL